MVDVSDIPTEEVVKWAIAEVIRQGEHGDVPTERMIRAWQYGIKILNERRTFTSLREEDLHILGGLVKGRQGSAGPYQKNRDTPATFANGDHALEAELIPRQMRLLILHQHDMERDEFVKLFLDIHPFEDGNGRVASILWNIRNGTLEHPVMMPDFYKKED